MSASLAAETRRAYAAAAARLGPSELDLVSRTRVARNAASGERDRLLGAVIGFYRTGDKPVWAAVLLDLVTPAMLARLTRLSSDVPAVDLEDLRSQFLVEVLQAAATMPMPANARFVERRLILRAGWRVRRWLGRERRWRSSCVALESITGEVPK